MRMWCGTREDCTRPQAPSPAEAVPLRGVRKPVTPRSQSRRRAALTTLFGTGATVAVTVAQAFVLIPLSLLHLGTHLYGAWLGAFELLIWLQLLDMGIPNLMTQRIGAAVGH